MEDILEIAYVQFDKDVGNTFQTFWVGVVSLGGNLALSNKIKMSIAFHLSTPHPGIHPTEVLLKGSKEEVQRTTVMSPPNGKSPKFPTI